MLSIENLTAGYGGAAVLRGVSFEVEAGRVLAVIGPNGCGKSTLLRCVSGLLRPSAGRVLLDGRDIGPLTPRQRARLVALLPQDGGSDEMSAGLSVWEMAGLGRTPHLGPYGAPGEADRAIVESALRAVQAWTLRERRVGTLSGGERQRVFLARALAQQAPVLLLDEPASGLDIRLGYEILGAVRRLARAQNLAVVVVLHQINLAALVCDTMALLHEGTVRAQGAPQQVMTRQHLEAVYQTPLQIAPHPRSARPQARSEWVFEEGDETS